MRNLFPSKPFSFNQVQLHTNLEKKLPNSLLQRWTTNEVVIYLHKGICNRASTLFKQVSWIEHQ